MSKALISIGFVVGAIVWLWTTFLAWANWGLLAALIAFFFPPADLIMMFMLGTWPFGLLATAIFGIGALVGRNDES